MPKPAESKKVIKWKDYPVTIRPRTDGRWVIYWREAGKGMNSTASTEKEAEEKALEIAKRVYLGQGGRTVTVEDAEILAVVKRLSGDQSVFSWLREIEQCQTRLKGSTIQQAVNHFIEAGFLDVEAVSLESATELYLKKYKGLSKHSINQPRQELNGFNKAFPGVRVIELTEERVGTWVARARKDEKPPEPKYFNNRVKTWKAFLRWCQSKRRKYWPAGDPHPAAHIELMTEPRKAVPIWEPETAHAILALLPERLRPYLIIGCWLGLRPYEIRRLRWELFDWRRDYLHCDETVVHKTPDERFVPINPKAKALLAPWIQATGAVFNAGDDAEISKLARAAKLIAKWEKDVMRHSYISYLIATGVSKAKIAEWAGNSEKIIKKHYRRPLREEDGKAWFALG